MTIQHLTTGPIVGHTTTASIRLWGRGRKPQTGQVCVVCAELTDADTGQRSSYSEVRAAAEHDYTCVIDFDGLDAEKNYLYRMGFYFAGVDDENRDIDSQADFSKIKKIEIRTAPGDQRDISFVFGSCRRIKPSDPKEKGDRVFGSIVSQLNEGWPTDAMLMIGDQIYADELEKYPAHKRLKGFWKLYRSAFGQPNIAELMSRVPTYMCLDDHEIKNNWSMDELDSHRELFLDAIQAYLSYQLIHGPAFQRSPDAEEDDSPESLYFNMTLGKADFFFTDTRTERFPSANQIISQEQMEALFRWLRDSDGLVKFIVSSVPFLPGYGSEKEKWSDKKFKAQRDRIIGFIHKEKIKNVYLLCGDAHLAGYCTLQSEHESVPLIRQLISSQFYWPWYMALRPTGDSEEGELINIDGTKYFVQDSELIYKKPNFSRVLVSDNSVRFQVFNKKGKAKSDPILFELD